MNQSLNLQLCSLRPGRPRTKERNHQEEWELRVDLDAPLTSLGLLQHLERVGPSAGEGVSGSPSPLHALLPP